MNDYHGNVAVITGAASGIGFALAQRSARVSVVAPAAELSSELRKG